MNATDVEPTRLVSSQRAATAFVEDLLEKFRVGIVSFASTAQTLTRPTTDRVAVYGAIDLAARRGDGHKRDGIERALDVKRRRRRPPAARPGRSCSPVWQGGADEAPLVVLLLSDGANTQGRTQPMEAADDAGARGAGVHHRAGDRPGDGRRAG